MLPLARNSLRLVRAFRHQFPQHITGHTARSTKNVGQVRFSIRQPPQRPALSVYRTERLRHNPAQLDADNAPSPSGRGLG